MPVNGYAVYITDQTTKKKIELPVNPAEVELTYETDDASNTVINLGEVNTPGYLKLVSLTIESTFPKRKLPFVSVKKLSKPDTYIKNLKSMQSKKHKVRVVVSGTKISLLMTISSFKYGLKNGNVDEYLYTLELKQYRSYSYKKLKNKKKGKGKKGKSRSSPAGKVGRGSSVIVNGRLHADSYGRGAGMYEKNAKRTVLYIAPGRKYPVCVGINGVPRGWVKMSEVKKA